MSDKHRAYTGDNPRELIILLLICVVVFIVCVTSLCVYFFLTGNIGPGLGVLSIILILALLSAGVFNE